jgi:tellurite resistance protein TerC
MESVGSLSTWAGFGVFVIIALAIDLALHRDAHEIGFTEALAWSVVWIALALLFNGFVYVRFGREAALQFFTGYLVEKSLSVDNIFVFVALFQAFAVPARLQHRVLFWGIIGAVSMRAVFIFAGAALIARFHWVMYLFGGLLILTGGRLLVRRGPHVDARRIPPYRAFARIVPLTADYVGDHFIVQSEGRRKATPLLAALFAVETVDVIFAVDSIPAIFAITQDPFLVFTSNIFAILGLRAMFFLIGDAVVKFRHLGVGLALVLLFIGAKMIATDFVEVSSVLSLAVIVGLIGASVLASLR